MRLVLHSDNEAFQSYQNGEERGFLHFFEGFNPSLSYFAYSLLNDQPAAEDIADESFLKAWDRRQTFQSPENLKAFLFHVTKNACLSLLHHRKMARSVHEEILYTTDKSAEGIDEQIARQEALAQVYSLVDILPPRCRQVFTLYYQEGKSSKEIAQHLQLSINTVRVQKAKAIALIKSRLAGLKFFLLTALVILKDF